MKEVRISHYVTPFDLLMRQVGVADVKSRVEVTLTLDQLTSLIRYFLRSVPVDEAWYRGAYPDVDEAIQAGACGSAKEHFVSSGYFEGRRAGKVVIDEKWYLAKYPDIAEGIEFGEIESAQAHYDMHGAAEGRFPHEV